MKTETPGYYLSACPNTKMQFLVQYGKEGNIIELNDESLKLTAAAPEMLIALKACKARMEELQKHTDYPLVWPRELAQEAINKATL
jgi:hypothetical protein|tara:strand:+ start:5806 stop:6063 length:258 start_codon:yes stop_codon:yes gene_type:complete